MRKLEFKKMKQLAQYRITTVSNAGPISPNSILIVLDYIASYFYIIPIVCIFHGL